MESAVYKIFGGLFIALAAMAVAGKLKSNLMSLEALAEKSQRRGLVSIVSINRQLF